MAIITVARQTGSDGEVVAEQVARELGFTLLNRSRLDSLTKEHGLTGRELDESDEERHETVGAQVHVDYLQAVLLELAGKEDLVIVGRGGQFLFRDCPWTLHVKVVAGLAARRAALQRDRQVSAADADAGLAEADRRRAEWIRSEHGTDWADPAHYDLVVRTDGLGVTGAAAIVKRAAEVLSIAGHLTEIADWIDNRLSDVKLEGLGTRSSFVHPSEEELARVLDFYQIHWHYEPKSFPLAKDELGNITEAFTPDFYLPDLDLYLELTTLKQSLVTDKNRKIRKFRELYPDIRLKVFYGRDFRSLVQKYGIAPAAATPVISSSRESEGHGP
jgi:cytidylate kinase